MDKKRLCKSQVRHSGVSLMEKTYVKLRPQNFACYLTCNLCNNIFKEATTINRCNHTFCRKCIYKKIQAERIKCCPTCKEDLSSFPPKDYLRPDETLRGMIETLFGKSTRIKQSETLQVTPTKIASTIVESSTQEDVSEIDKKLMTQSKKKRNMTRKRRQFPSCQEKNDRVKAETEEKNDQVNDETEKALEEILESNSSGPIESVASKGKGKENSSKNDHSVEHGKKLQSIWFHLGPQEDDTGHVYPQLAKPFIHLKDGDVQASMINKYLMKKLNLEGEDEVELCCFGEPLIKTLTLSAISDIWIDCVTTVPPSYLKNVGAKEPDGKKFVMKLTYRRRKKPIESPNKPSTSQQSSC